jgi:hypothetical protein
VLGGGANEPAQKQQSTPLILKNQVKKMSNEEIRNVKISSIVSTEVRAELKKRVSLEETSISDLINKLINQYLDTPLKK